MRETPDAYITRHEMELEPGPPPEEDRCPVCLRFDCVCSSDAEEANTHKGQANDWDEWTQRLYDAHPHSLVVLEQQVMRSKAEKRCARCGDPATIRKESGLIKSVSHYFFCDNCEAHYANK